MFNQLKPAAAMLSLFAFFMASACGPQPVHPNALNPFDGASYDTLTVAHSALISLRAQVISTYPKYTPAFNQAAAAYTTAFNGYALYRSTTANQADTAAALANLTASVVTLENTFLTDMHAPSAQIAQAHQKANTLRAHAAPSITISDILVELQIAATVAQAIPAAQPYAALAAIVINATSQALAAHTAAAGQPIDLTTIQPVPSIS